jgi:hypothetical protein
MNRAWSWLRAHPATVAGLALAVLATWEVAVLAQVHGRAPTDRDWRAAAAAVAEAHAPGDQILFAPSWVDPVGRRWLGQLLDPADAGFMDLARYGRIWELSIRGATAKELRGRSAAFSRTFGAVRVRRFDQAAATVTWRAHEGGPILEVAHRPRQCLRVIGPRSFEGVSLGSELQVYAGLADVWARKENRAFALVRVFVDGEERARASVGNDSGWLALPRIATTPGPHDVAFEVTVDPERGDPRRARLDTCLAAEARSPAP